MPHDQKECSHSVKSWMEHASFGTNEAVCSKMLGIPFAMPKRDDQCTSSQKKQGVGKFQTDYVISMMCFANGTMRTVSQISERCSLVLHGVVCHQNRGVGFANEFINFSSF